ncbi:hypothetical protein [Streptomyces sp. STCH 565 A]|uniref:hypothetical protein n=1 Tax=Streptomyces sp. STCH 565 A TaxID=2950532 RepID=UPI0020752851|nr:hypothetical protein [Streptomyces sp. STCH 565 A]MCM8555375.1 hypothetical protein [Streptomyces sp. STCH 565 A]
MGAPHSAERIQAVRRMASEGLSDREIGERLQLSKNAVQIIRNKNNIPAGKKISVPSETVEAIRRMAAEGERDGEIGAAVGMTKAAVSAVRYRNGIEAGNKPEYHRHGTPSMYNSGCRCETCSKRQSERAADLKARREERLQARGGAIEHGACGYANWGCRCETCTTASAAKSRVYRASSQAQTIPVARNHRKEWTGSELELAARTDLTANEVAKMLGRTFNAVTTMRSRMEREPKYASLAGIPQGEAEPTA